MFYFGDLNSFQRKIATGNEVKKEKNKWKSILQLIIFDNVEYFQRDMWQELCYHLYKQ